jgi:Na+-driven multidrug efflux pump
MGEAVGISMFPVFGLILAVNLLVAAVALVVWHTGGRRLAKTIIAALISGVILTAILIFAWRRLFMLFSVHKAILAYFVPSIRAYALGFPLAALNIALSTYLLANGRRMYFLIGRYAVVLLSLPIAYFLLIAYQLGAITMILAFVAVELVVTIINIVLVVNCKNQR